MLAWLFRPQCVACAAPGPGPFCAVCQEALCEAPAAAPGGALGIAAPWLFGGPLAIAIRRLKFTSRTHIARDLAPLWAPLVAAAVALGGGDAIVVPVPLHWRRRLTRGFDQSWLLALHACRHAGLARPRSLLRRTRWTPPQSTLPAGARRGNVVGAFHARRTVAGRSIVLVDDVVTTGSTLAAAAAALQAAGARSVTCLALARA